MLLSSIILQLNMSDTTAMVAQVESTTKSLNLWDMALSGGWIMIPLLLLFLLSIYLFIERFVAIKQAGYKDPTFMDRIRDYIHDGKIDSAKHLCKQNPSPAARMVEKGISRMGRPLHDVQVAIENVGNIEVAKLEKGFNILATIAGGAPMIGFLGTVIGMVQAFFDMANAGSNVDITVLSSGIYTALTTTVAGLIVGITALFAYNYLVSRVTVVVNRMEATTMDFMDVLNEPQIKR